MKFPVYLLLSILNFLVVWTIFAFYLTLDIVEENTIIFKVIPAALCGAVYGYGRECLRRKRVEKKSERPKLR